MEGGDDGDSVVGDGAHVEGDHVAGDHVAGDDASMGVDHGVCNVDVVGGGVGVVCEASQILHGDDEAGGGDV